MSSFETCAEQLDNAFTAAVNSYKKIVTRINSGKYDLKLIPVKKGYEFVPKKNVNYRYVQNIPPTSVIYELYHQWAKTGIFRAEIQKNYLSNNSHYYIFLKRAFAKHFQFIADNFKDSVVNSFLKDRNAAEKLAFKLHLPGTQLTKEEVLLAIQYDFLNLFSLFEHIFSYGNPQYLPCIGKENELKSTNASGTTEIDFYGIRSLSENQWLDLYNWLVENDFLVASLEVFRQCFGLAPKVTDDKILWIDKNQKNKEINKKTLFQLIVSLTRETSKPSLLYKFIGCAFRSDNIQNGIDIPMKRDNLKESFRSFNTSRPTSRQLLIIKKIKGFTE